MIRRLALLAAAAAILAAPASAQLMGATELKVAVPVRGVASSKPVADIYYLVGESGARETYTLTGKGPASITLFGPDGSEILTASGSGAVKLEVVLPFTDVFTLAVARKVPATPYTLSRKTTVPTLTESVMALSAGYEGTYLDQAGNKQRMVGCWITPGMKLREVYPTGTQEFTLAADRKTISFVFRTGSRIVTGDYTYSMNGNTLTRTERIDGKVSQKSADASSSLFDGEVPSGYLCKD